jgi:calcineurin-like phosphoesterase family protein
MNNRVFVISDTHFGHKKIIGFEATFRPFETIDAHDRELVARWNAVVRPKDTVWHLGDVFFGKDGHKVLGELNGLKKLVLGNHDHYPLDIYNCYFVKIYGAAEFSDCLLTHVPVHESQMYRYRINVHGHMHSKSIPDPRWRCVSAEHTGLAPMLMSDAIGSAPATGENR